jgi:hypothetical protein
MSYDDYDDSWDAGREEYEADVAQRAVEEFQTERLQSYYRDHRDLAMKPVEKLDQARSILAASPNAALVLAVSSIEVGLKAIVMRPIMSGLVHAESFSELITEMFVKSSKADDVLKIVNRLLKEYASIDLQTMKLANHRMTYWQEIGRGQEKRNAILHRAENCTREDAEGVVELADYLWGTIFPALLNGVGLHTHDSKSVCDHPISYCDSVRLAKDLGHWSPSR